MIKNKSSKASCIRITIASIALVLYIIVEILCRNLVISSDESYESYKWRVNFLSDIICAAPYFTLLAIVIFEKIFKKINIRYVILVFFIVYLGHYFVVEHILGLSIIPQIQLLFTSTILESVPLLSLVAIFAAGLTIPMVLAKQDFILPYFCITLITFNLITFVIYTICYFSNGMHMGIFEIGRIFTEILLCGCLLSLDNLLKEDNVIVHKLSRENSKEYTSNLRDLVECNDYYDQYQRLLAWAFFKKRTDILNTEKKLEEIAIFPDESGESTDFYFEQFSLLREQVLQLLEQTDGYIEESFLDAIEVLLSEKENDLFDVEAVTFAKVLTNESNQSWNDAVSDLKALCMLSNAKNKI